MGNLTPVSFQRHDDIEGQGKSLLTYAKRAYIKNRDLDRLFEVFRKFCTSAEDCVDIHEFLMANRTRPSFFSKCFRCSCFSKKQSQCYPSNLFEAYIFQQYTSNNWLNFEQFVISLWAFLATSNDLLYAYCFNMLDVSRANSLQYSEIQLLVSLVYDFNVPTTVRDAIAHLANNVHGVVTIAEFVLLCRHYPVVLSPVVRFRDRLKSRIIFRRFWREIAVRRIFNFGDKTAFCILGTLTVEQQLASLEKLLLMNNHVPEEVAQLWTRTVQKKPSDDIQTLPFEIDPEYVPPVLPVPEARVVIPAPPTTSMYLQRELLKSMDNRMVDSKASLKPLVSSHPYVSRKPLIEDDSDIKVLLRRIKKEVKKRRTMVTVVESRRRVYSATISDNEEESQTNDGNSRHTASRRVAYDVDELDSHSAGGFAYDPPESQSMKRAVYSTKTTDSRRSHDSY